MEDKVLHLDCECNSPEHITRYSLWYWGDDVPPELLVEVQAGHYLPWYKRIVVAIKYIFGYEGVKWHDAYFKRTDIDKLQKMLDDYKVAYDEYDNLIEKRRKKKNV
jgi:hypothetical protein